MSRQIKDVTDDELVALADRLNSASAAARELGLSERSVRHRVQRARYRKVADPAIVGAADALGANPASIGLVWHHRKNEDDGSWFTALVRNEVSSDVVNDTIDQIFQGVEQRRETASPVLVDPERWRSGSSMMVITPADIHIGKLADVMETGNTYDIQTAERRTKEGVASLLDKARFWGVERITINTGNDSMHIDTPRRTTTSGTPQDTHGTIFTMADAAFATWAWVIEEAVQVAPVHVVFDPSNHPWVCDWLVNRAVMAHFRNTPGVTFDVMMQSIRHRKYQVYGCNLIGYTHHDGAKEKDLPNLMQYEARKWWGKTKRGYWILKHRHHKDRKRAGFDPIQLEKDHPGVTVIRTAPEICDRNVALEIVRSPSESDGWHDRNGYVGAIKAVEAFVFDADRGQVARFTEVFE